MEVKNDTNIYEIVDHLFEDKNERTSQLFFKLMNRITT